MGVRRLGPREPFVDRALARRLLHQHQDAAVGTEGHDLGGDQGTRGGRRVQQGVRRELDGRHPHREPADVAQPLAELEELVERALDRLPHQVLHVVAQVAERPDRFEPCGDTRLVGSPARAQEHAGQLILLRHVVQQVPPEVVGAISPRCSSRHRDDGALDPVHPTSSACDGLRYRERESSDPRRPARRSVPEASIGSPRRHVKACWLLTTSTGPGSLSTAVRPTGRLVQLGWPPAHSPPRSADRALASAPTNRPVGRTIR